MEETQDENDFGDLDILREELNNLRTNKRYFLKGPNVATHRYIPPPNQRFENKPQNNEPQYETVQE
jgi:hypothetical protein